MSSCDHTCTDLDMGSGRKEKTEKFDQVCANRNWKRFQRETSKDAGPFFFKWFSHIFAVAKQLPDFSISRLASVENFLNVSIF